MPRPRNCPPRIGRALVRASLKFGGRLLRRRNAQKSAAPDNARSRIKRYPRIKAEVRQRFNPRACLLPLVGHYANGAFGKRLKLPRLHHPDRMGVESVLARGAIASMEPIMGEAFSRRGLCRRPAHDLHWPPALLPHSGSTLHKGSSGSARDGGTAALAEHQRDLKTKPKALGSRAHALARITVGRRNQGCDPGLDYSRNTQRSSSAFKIAAPSESKDASV
jgi:hypothetical protein